MVVQNLEGEVSSFPAVPDAWEKIEFYNVPTSGGYKANGKMLNGLVEKFQLKKESDVIYQSDKPEKISLNF